MTREPLAKILARLIRAAADAWAGALGDLVRVGLMVAQVLLTPVPVHEPVQVPPWTGHSLESGPAPARPGPANRRLPRDDRFDRMPSNDHDQGGVVSISFGAIL